MVRQLFIILSLTLCCHNIYAKQDSIKNFTYRDTLVFEDSESIWPYTFLNEEGKPEGYAIDLLDMLMEELNIPYVVHLKNHQEVLKDLKEGKADLILGLGDVYEEKYGHYSQTTITLLTQSVATPKSQPVLIKAFRDLKNNQVIVKDSGLCHHLMVDYGWGENALVTHDVATAIKEVNDQQKGQIVWNTMTLKWLIDHYKLDKLTLTPVNMPHGETKFLARDQELLDLIDKTYTKLSVAGKLQPLEEKWLYPDHQKPIHHQWIWYVAAVAVILLLAATVFLIIELRRNNRCTRYYHKMAHRLAEAARRNKMRFWIYHVSEQKFTWHDDNGQAIGHYTTQEFATRYNKEDFTKLEEAIYRLVEQQLDENGHQEKEETLELKAKDTEAGDAMLHDFVLHLSVLSSDANDKPTAIIGAKKDITKEHLLQKENAERSLRYLSMFYDDKTGIMFFNKNGNLMNANTKVGELLECDIDDMVRKHVFLNKVLNTVYTNLIEANGKTGILTVGQKTVNYSIKAVFGEYSDLLGIFVFCV